MISPDLIQSIREKADIVTVIGHYLQIVKKGANYAAVCPFHDDTRPSLMISPSKQIFKCFVCGTSGNCFTFVQKYERLDFIDAVKKVASICNLDAPELFEMKPARPKANARELKAVEDLAGFYHFSLRQPEGQTAFQYLQSRHMSDEVIDHFRIGYAPADAARSIKLLREKMSYEVETLERAGILAGTAAGFFDRYRDRIMFPLENTSGDVVGFSGRIYKPSDSGESKYVNSPESVIFKKSDLLYNFKNARETCRKDGYLYVLEGFMDVIALFKAGIESAVALMGTALTADHIRLFRELGVEIRLCLDSDNAGQLATFKSSDLLTKAGIKYKIVSPVDDGKDPDELLNAVGPDGLKESLNRLEEPVVFEILYLLRQGRLVTLESKQEFLKEHLGVLHRYDELARAEVIGRLAAALNLSEDRIADYVERKKSVSIEKAVNSPPEYREIDPSLENQSALLKYVSSLLQDRSISRRLHQLYSYESGLISKMAQSFAAFKEFESQGGVFYLNLFTKLQLLLGDYYLKTGKAGLELEDYQIMIDELELRAESDRQPLIDLLERLKQCRANPYDPDGFRETMGKHKVAYELYMHQTYLMSEDETKAISTIDSIMRKTKTADRKHREK